MARNSKIILLIILCLQIPCLATLNMRGQSSYFRVAAGANFVANQPINNFSGKLIRDQGGTSFRVIRLPFLVAFLKMPAMTYYYTVS